MREYTLKEIAEILDCACPCDRENIRIHGVCTDSRKVLPGNLYIPLKGETFDGHRFIESAISAGASAALTEEEFDGDKVSTPLLRVHSTLEALGKIAAAWRREVNPILVALTGSVGKTTTKDMTAAVLAQKYKTHKTSGNFNNEIGLPMTLLTMEPSTEVAVCEMGMNHRGEMARLTAIATPDVAMVINIGSAHIEYLGSREGIRDAKLEILQGLRPEGTFLYNGDEPLLKERKSLYPTKTLTFGLNTDNDLRGSGIEVTEEGTSFTVNGVPFHIGLMGEHIAKDALAAIACGKALGVSLEEASAALAEFHNPSALRQNCFTAGEVAFVVDCYNAGPESMRAAMETVALRKNKGRKIAVLGVMRELGEASPEYHRVAAAQASGIFDMVYTFGDRENMYLAGCSSARPFFSREELTEALAVELQPGDLVFFKGSRLNYLEKVSEALSEKLVGRQETH